MSASGGTRRSVSHVRPRHARRMGPARRFTFRTPPGSATPRPTAAIRNAAAPRTMPAENDSVPGCRPFDVERTDDPLAGLIACAAHGDERALAALYDRTASHVHGLVMRILKDESGAEEVTVDVYRQIWRQAARF